MKGEADTGQTAREHSHSNVDEGLSKRWIIPTICFN